MGSYDVNDERLDPRRVQCVLVGMMFDPDYAARVLGDAPLPELSSRERLLLRGVDPRALGTDRYRRARAVSVLLDEFPVTATVLGVPAVDRFFATEAFRASVWARGSMALACGAWIGARAHGVGRLETAIAHVRRHWAPRESGSSGAAVASPGRLRALVVPAGTLAYHQRARQRLGPEPAVVLARRDVRTSERPPQRGAEYLLVERRDDGSIDVGTGSEPLVRLLAFAHTPRSQVDLEAEAVRWGAEPDEAAPLIADLVEQGLLTVAR